MGGARKCVVLDCVNNNPERKNKKVSYHEVPSDEKQRKQWLKRLLPYMDPCCQRQLFHVCGDHFADEYFVSSPSKRKILIRGAIPTIFNMKESNLVVTSSDLKENEDSPEDGAESTSQFDQNEEINTISVKQEICEMEVEEEDENQYLFNSVKVHKDSGRGEICRTCFKSATRHKKLTDRHVTRTQTYKEMMEFLALDINFNFYPDPVICLNCIMLLLNAFDFKKKCQKTEKSLNKYYTNRASTDKPTNLLIVAFGRKKNEPITSEVTIKINQSPTTEDDQSDNTGIEIVTTTPSPKMDAILIDHDYDVRTAEIMSDDSTIKEEYEEEIHLSVEPPPPPEVKEEPVEVLPASSKPTRIAIWGDPPYLCEMCGRMFHNRRQCRRHLRVHRIQNETVESYYCEICECTYSNVNVAVHMDTHRVKKYECDVCGRRFDRKNLLVNHKVGAHEKAAFVSCEVCGKRCPRKQLNAHVARHYDTKDAKCHICDRLVYRMLLKKHIRSHGKPKHRTVCYICGKSVVSDLMKSHVWRHNGSPKYKCEVCDVAFFSEKELQVHFTRKKHVRNLMLEEVTRKERTS